MLELREGRLGIGVHACSAIAPGQLILRTPGRAGPHRTRHTIQVDFDRHVDFPAPLRFLNHSCDPNCGLLLPRGTDLAELYARKAIQPGEELTIDYCTFENEIHYMPGPCLCGSSCCRVRVSGFRDLTPEHIAAYGPYLAEYLLPVEVISQAG